MALPGVTQTITDGALGTVPADSSANTAVIGIASSGTVDTVYSYTSSDAIDSLRTTNGYGPGPEAAAYDLATDGSPVYFVRADSTGGTAAACSAVTLTGTGLNPGVTVNTATTYDDYQVKVLIVLGGAVATATFKYSLDNGDTYSAVITSAATYVLPNTGITIAFTAGTYVAGDVYSFTATAAAYSTTKLGTAVDALLASSNQFGLLQVVGRPAGANDGAKATAYASLAAAVQTKLDTAAGAYRYCRAICDGPDVANDSTADALLTAAFAATDAARVVATAGDAEMYSALVSGRRHKRPTGWAITARARQIPIHEEPGFVGRGSLGSSIALKTAETTPTQYLDSRTRSTLHDARFATLRTHIGLQGIYVTQALTMANALSDFKTLPLGRVMDRACQVAYTELLRLVNGTVRVNASTGYILEQDAIAIENRVAAVVRAAITQPGHASSATVTVNRNTNLLTTPNLKTKIRIVPLGYLTTITNEIGYLNPALFVAAA